MPNNTNTTEQLQNILRSFESNYQTIEGSFKVSYLKYIHCATLYQIILDGSDTRILQTLPSEPLKPTAVRLAREMFEGEYLESPAFRVLLPFMIYDYANICYGRFPNCDSEHNALNNFQLLIARVREQCVFKKLSKNQHINPCDPKGDFDDCKIFAIQEFQRSINETIDGFNYTAYNGIASPAAAYLEITGNATELSYDSVSAY
jgi:hypothetical protein